MNKLSFAILSIIFISNNILFSLPINLPEEIENELNREGFIKRFSSENESLMWIPNLPLASDLRIEEEQLSPLVTTESLFIIPFETQTTQELILLAVNSLCNLNTLEGLDYFSVTKNKFRPLFTSARIIDSPENQESIPPPVITNLPVNLQLYAEIDDTTFGLNLYRFTIKADLEGISFSMVNINTLRYLFIKGADPENLRFDFLFIPKETDLLLYSACMADIAPILLLKTDLAESFSNRLIALKNWFTQQMTSE